MRSAITQTSCRSLALALYDAVDRTLFWLNPELASHFHSAGARSRFPLELDEDESATLLLFELLLLLLLFEFLFGRAADDFVLQFLKLLHQ